MHMNLDPFLVDKIVDEVKSQGVFDQFRKDSMSDVDTKPAYQNLRQRVETTVSKFLGDQTWAPEMNKNQLREKLRKHITEAGFLDTGVERIVDQVVNPKISTIFQPKIEDIAYKYLGIEKPQIKPEVQHDPSLTNGNLLISTDLMPTDLEAVSPDSDKGPSKSGSREDIFNDSEDKNEEFESPPFEPLEGRAPSPGKKEESNQSHASGISGLTSPDSIESKSYIGDTSVLDCGQGSELSQVSSNSHLSIVTAEDTKLEIKKNNVDFSEEAQMPRFSDNTNSVSNINQPLHFDIKKEEIKFEGTDRNPTTIEYNMSLDQSKLGNTKGENSMEIKESVTKTEELSASSNATYSTESQNSSEKSQIFAKLKIEKESPSWAQVYESEKEQSKNITEDTNDSQLSIKESDRLNTNERAHNHTDNEDKSTAFSESNLQPNEERKNRSSSPKSKSSHGHHKSKYRDHRSKSSRDDEYRSRNRSKKHKREKGEKDDDHSNARKKNYRRKSTDSNDGNANKESSRKCSHTLLGKSEASKESPNNSNTSSFSSNSANGTTNGQSSVQADSYNTISNHNVNMKPVVLDNMLTSIGKKDVELLIGERVQIVQNNSISESCSNISKDEDLYYFEIDPSENLMYNDLIAKLSKAIEDCKIPKKLYTLNCDDEYLSVLISLGVQEIDNEFSLPEQTPVTELNGTDDNKLSSFTHDNVGNKPDKRKYEEIISDEVKSCIINENFTGYDSPENELLNVEQIYSTHQTLILDCLEYNSNDHVNKRIKGSQFTETTMKVSPTPSELSIGSKENEFAGKVKQRKQSGNIETGTIPEKKPNIAFKTNQRYSSEDLYKPRPVLSQRSRRRAVDSEMV